MRIGTKWRKYHKGLSAYKQGLNRVARELIHRYPDTNFIMEKLLFKGKQGRSREFRRRNKNWAYQHLFPQLQSWGYQEGFLCIPVNPKDSSITCPVCGRVDSSNRADSSFHCRGCGYQKHADTVGAMNLMNLLLKSKLGELGPHNWEVSGGLIYRNRAEPVNAKDKNGENAYSDGGE